MIYYNVIPFFGILRIKLQQQKKKKVKNLLTSSLMVVAICALSSFNNSFYQKKKDISFSSKNSISAFNFPGIHSNADDLSFYSV